MGRFAEQPVAGCDTHAVQQHLRSMQLSRCQVAQRNCTFPCPAHSRPAAAMSVLRPHDGAPASRSGFLAGPHLAAQHAQHCRGVLPAIATVLLWQQCRGQACQRSSQHVKGTASEARITATEQSIDPQDDQPDTTKDEIPTSNVAEIASIQTPASVWLPSRGASRHQDKVSTVCS